MQISDVIIPMHGKNGSNIVTGNVHRQKKDNVMSFLFKLIVWIVPVIWLSYPVITAGFDVGHNKIVGTHYTGPTWAPAFWSNLNIHDVHDDLLEIKQNGFNAIIIVVYQLILPFNPPY